TFSGNLAATTGGGLSFAGGVDTLTNVTVSENIGGGMAVSAAAAAVTLVNDTFFNNTGDGVTRTAGSITTTNSLFGRNTLQDFNGAITTDNGFNLFQSSIGVSGTVATDLLNKPARLAPLANYGGPTQTNAILPGSFALDTGTLSTAITDVRGLTRP